VKLEDQIKGVATIRPYVLRGRGFARLTETFPICSRSLYATLAQRPSAWRHLRGDARKFVKRWRCRRMAFTLEIAETFKRFQPLAEVLALSPDGRDSNRLGGDCSFNNLSVRRVRR